MMIIVIDDNAEMLQCYKDLLGHDYTVQLFSDPIRAVDYIKANEKAVDLILTDQNMTPIKGSEIIKALRLFNIKCPMLLATGQEDPTIVMDLVDFEGRLKIEKRTVFREKPYDIEGTVEEIIGFYERVRETARRP